MEISFGQCYSRTGVTQTLKGNEKQFELARDSNYWDKLQCDLDQGKKISLSYQGIQVICVQVIEVLQLYFPWL